MFSECSCDGSISELFGKKLWGLSVFRNSLALPLCECRADGDLGKSEWKEESKREEEQSRQMRHSSEGYCNERKEGESFEEQQEL